MAEKDIEVGDQVEWNYGRGHPQGTVIEINSTPGEKMVLETKKGNNITRNADPKNPAVMVEGQGAEVVKKMSELEKVAEGEGHAEGAGEQQATEGKEEPATGQKRGRNPAKRKGKAAAASSHEESSKTGEEKREDVAQEKAEEPDAKKQKLDLETDTRDAEGESDTEVRAPHDKPPSENIRSRGKKTSQGQKPSEGRKTSARTKKDTKKTHEKGPAAPEGLSAGDSLDKPLTLEEPAIDDGPVEVAISKAPGDTEGTNIPVVGDMPKAHD